VRASSVVRESQSEDAGQPSIPAARCAALPDLNTLFVFPFSATRAAMRVIVRVLAASELSGRWVLGVGAQRRGLSVLHSRAIASHAA